MTPVAPDLVDPDLYFIRSDGYRPQLVRVRGSITAICRGSASALPGLRVVGAGAAADTSRLLPFLKPFAVRPAAVAGGAGEGDCGGG
jgi:hypothetical protein